MAELLRSPLGVALGAKAADVAVVVRSAMGQRHDVVRHGRLADNPSASTIAAEGLRAEAAQTLGNSAAPTRPKCQPKLRRGIPSQRSTAGGNTLSAGLTSLDEQR
jgi:hypothetical protein